MRSPATSTPAPRRSRPSFGDEGAFALIEILVSALIMVTISGGALAALQANNRAGSEERHRARADGVAQEDQARMRSMRISDLANLNQTRTVTAGRHSLHRRLRG